MLKKVWRTNRNHPVILPFQVLKFNTTSTHSSHVYLTQGIHTTQIQEIFFKGKTFCFKEVIFFNDIKRTVILISSGPLHKDNNVRFTIVTLKPLSDIKGQIILTQLTQGISDWKFNLKID